jgi:hypothetical protein
MSRLPTFSFFFFDDIILYANTFVHLLSPEPIHMFDIFSRISVTTRLIKFLFSHSIKGEKPHVSVLLVLDVSTNNSYLSSLIIFPPLKKEKEKEKEK